MVIDKILENSGKWSLGGNNGWERNERKRAGSKKRAGALTDFCQDGISCLMYGMLSLYPAPKQTCQYRGAYSSLRHRGSCGQGRRKGGHRGTAS